MDALLRRRAMIAAGGGSPTPPAPVVSVPYIRGGADGSYIDTGITADNTTRVIVWARNWNPTSSFLFGSRTSAGVDGFSLGTHTGTQTGLIRVDYAQTNNTLSSDAFDKLGSYHKYELYQGVCKVDDVVVATATQSAFSNQHNIHIIGNNNGGTHMNVNLPIDICACQIYKNNVLVRDFTAVSYPSVGLYDAVSGTVFTNAGTGSFTYGTFDENAYIPLAYIECNGAQYFDSGVYGTYSLPIVSKFMPTNATPKWDFILGQRIDSPANSCDFSLGNTQVDNMYMYWRLGSDTSSVRCFDGTASNKLTNKAVVIVKNNAAATVYYNGTQIGTATKTGVSTSFVTTRTLTVACVRAEETPIRNFATGRFYYVGFGAERSFVPARKNNSIGMYDTYNDRFYPSATSTPFIAPI